MRLSSESRELLKLQHLKFADEVFRKRRHELEGLKQEAYRSGPARAGIDRLYVEVISEVLQAKSQNYLTAFRREGLIPTDDEIREITEDLSSTASSLWYSGGHQPFPSSQDDYHAIVPRVRLELIVAVKAMRLEAKTSEQTPPEREVATPKAHSTARSYVDPVRIEELRQLKPAAFDLSRLIALCEELNGVAAAHAHHATAMLVRALMDHVPPMFGVNSFAEVANNYAGSKSFKDSMQGLKLAARKIGDAHLHTQIRSRESLPTATQVNFAPQLDFLLSEIVRILR